MLDANFSSKAFEVQLWVYSDFLQPHVFPFFSHSLGGMSWRGYSILSFIHLPFLSCPKYSRNPESILCCLLSSVFPVALFAILHCLSGQQNSELVSQMYFTVLLKQKNVYFQYPVSIYIVIMMSFPHKSTDFQCEGCLFHYQEDCIEHFRYLSDNDLCVKDYLG